MATTTIVRMRLERATPGTYLFKAIDEAGRFLEPRDAKVANIYVRKTVFNGEGAPEEIEVTLTKVK